jgi:hypothetical protein
MKLDPTWKRLEPGLYFDDDGALHLDVVTFLENNGYAANEANQEMLIRTFKEYCGVPVSVVEDSKPS